ncbi:hypothetical protein M9Y10_044426 [Tritrichomonas musculus]|uniref:Uncharacterized protein n=1 Tax=Tritrichomonas musculus TaxID=1915356 RepID=A0ABR2JSA9_9EUKA
MNFLELCDAPATYENIAQILGYPTIEVNPEQRGKQCSNCGSHEHTYESCKLPKMDQLLEMFGQNSYDSTPNAVQAKKKIVSELYQKNV